MDISSKAESLARDYKGVKKVALSYSGGLDSVVVGTVLKKAGFQVFPVVVDIGQKTDLARVAKNAKQMFGSCSIANAREKFTEGVIRGIKANFGSGGQMNCGGLSRPAMAQALVFEARRLSCDAIAHGSSGTGNDHLTMENSLRVLAPDLRILAIVRDLDFKRDEALLFAKKERLITNMARANKYSVDENLWVRTIRQGEVSDPTKPIPEEIYKWTVSPEKAPSKPEDVEIEFLNGIIVFAKAGKREAKNAAEAIALLNETGGKHGVGRLDALDEKIAGLKIREIYECPAAAIILAAHAELESITLTTKELDTKQYVDSLWGRIVHDGGWYTRLRRGLDAFIDETERAVDGRVCMRLYKGSVRMLWRKSKHALYDSRLSTRDSSAVFSQKEARHFAKLYGLQDVIAYMIDVDS